VIFRVYVYLPAGIMSNKNGEMNAWGLSKLWVKKIASLSSLHVFRGTDIIFSKHHQMKLFWED
jgi:hypothetical protein